MRLSQRYADHSAELLTIVDYIMAGDGSPPDNAVRLGISAEEVNEIGELRAEYETAYAAYIDPATHNSITVQAMKEADDGAYSLILPLRQRLKSGRAKLTPEDYAHLGIHHDKTTRTPAEVPTDVPIPVLVHSAPMVLTFEATKQTTEGANRIRLPKNCRVAREVAILAQGTGPSESDFYMIETVGRSRFAIMFTASEAGMNMYLRIAYANTAGRGQRPHSANFLDSPVT